VPITVRFLPENRSWCGDEPTDLFLAAAACDILVEQPCGSKTICGKCRVRVHAGALPATPVDVRVLGTDAVADGWRLGCQLVLDADATVEVPQLTRAVVAKTFGDDTLLTEGWTPAVACVAVDLPEPDPSRQYAALTLLAHALGSTAAALSPTAHALRALGGAQACGRRVHVVLDEGRLVHAWPADDVLADGTHFGVAVDVGSTTLAAALVQLVDGAVAATAAQLNPQVRWGGDVISRIHWAQEHPDRAHELHDVLVTAIDALITQCLQNVAASRAQLLSMSVVGNPTMLHTLLGANLAPLGQAPYVGVWQGAWRGPARELGIELPPWAGAYVLPGVRSHVGADTVAAMLALGLDRREKPCLLIDLGTNSEVALGCRDFIVCTSTSAGPAFEGANIHHGMRAVPGAIEQVRIRPTGSIMARTIGGEEAVGICGSGLIDAAAELIQAGVIEASGRMRPASEMGLDTPARLSERLLDVPGVGRAVWLAGPAGKPVLLTAGDVRQLQLVKGSIYAGVQALLVHAGIAEADLDAVFIAGAFGSYIRKASAQAIGLIPQVDPERVHFAGNAAGAGARLALVSVEARARAERIAAAADYIELACVAGYHDAFVAAMAFPAHERAAEGVPT
jgi:uncharacterized 2Fe-2S/4Fe-4S cluster protein (DUF4445 family)